MAQAEIFGSTRILIPLDGSELAEQVLPHAAAIAGTEAELVLLGVVSDQWEERELAGRMFASPEQARDFARSTLRGKLEHAAADWLGDRKNVRIDIRVGDPASEILRFAGEQNAELIAIASHGRGAVGRMLFGSVADRIARAASVPVMIVRPRDASPDVGPARLGRIVLPHDGSDLANRAIPVAEALARRLSAPILVVRALDLSTVLMGFPDGYSFSTEMLDAIQDDARESAEATTKQLVADGFSATWGIWNGPPYDAIASACQPGDLIVISSHGRTGAKRWLLGSVAEKLIRQGPAPLILVPLEHRAAPTLGNG